MDASRTVVDARSMFSRVTMHVRIKGLRVMKLRVQLAQLVMALAARVAGCNLEIALDEGPNLSWQRVSLKPGDTLVIKSDQRLSADQIARIQTAFKSTFPENACVVLDSLTVQGVISTAP